MSTRNAPHHGRCRASRKFRAPLGAIRRLERTRRSAIKPARHHRLVSVASSASVCLLLAQGCASGNHSPFHIYDSPLLSGDLEPGYPRSRSYDPFQMSATGGVQNRSAQNHGGSAKPASTVIASIGEEEETSTLPALSAQKSSPAHLGESAPAADAQPPRTGASADASGEAAHAADYIWSVYALNGVTFSPESRQSIPALFRACKERGKVYHSSRPAIGDIVFFHNTVDSNQDGRNNDWYTHAAIVESLTENGAVTLLSYRGAKVSRTHMSLEQPDAAMDRYGAELNTQLRTPADGDAPFTQYLAGQLFAGTCAALGDQAQFIIVDNWEPGMQLND